MTSIRYPTSSSDETNASRSCRKKARDCQRAALTAKDPKVRLAFSHLAKIWREMAREADQETVEFRAAAGEAVDGVVATEFLDPEAIGHSGPVTSKGDRSWKS